MDLLDPAPFAFLGKGRCVWFSSWLEGQQLRLCCNEILRCRPGSLIVIALCCNSFSFMRPPYMCNSQSLAMPHTLTCYRLRSRWTSGRDLLRPIPSKFCRAPMAARAAERILFGGSSSISISLCSNPGACKTLRLLHARFLVEHIVPWPGVPDDHFHGRFWRRNSKTPLSMVKRQDVPGQGLQAGWNPFGR